MKATISRFGEIEDLNCNVGTRLQSILTLACLGNAGGKEARDHQAYDRGPGSLPSDVPNCAH
jgi:hypothetical protein